jgi:hypothetical protein
VRDKGREKTEERISPMSIDGTWNITVKTPVGPITSELVVRSDGSVVTGTLVGAEGADKPDTIFDGSFDGTEVAWKVKTTKPMPMTLKFKATVDGDSLAGRCRFGVMGSGELTGVRVNAVAAA